jgi:hypothetical protein
MSWLYSQALVEEYLGGTCLDGEQCVPLSGNLTQQAYCAPDKMTVFSRLSRFGMTYKPLTDIPGEELSMSSVVAFHVKTLVSQERVQELMEKEVECGDTWRGWLAKYDPDTSLWRTAQCSLLEDLNECLVILPRWGMTRNGLLWEQPTLEPITKETESGLKQRHSLPTPTCNPHLPNLKSNTTGPKNLMQVANGEWEHLMPPKLWPSPKARDWKDGRTEGTQNRDSPDLGKLVGQSKETGALNPTWVEWLMGWPLGWTDLKPLETDKSHCVPQQLGDC